MEAPRFNTLTIIYEGAKTLAGYADTSNVARDLAQRLSFVEVTPTEADQLFLRADANDTYRQSVPTSYCLSGRVYPNSGGYDLAYFMRWEDTLLAQKDYNENIT